ncbi:WD40-repeat-containing domain protein [Mycena amicta]|nr:WD40-repeat-containing domain protein [Mycena amicta]
MNTDYRLHSKLYGHSGAILSLGVREDGKFLASGGSDGTKVWDLVTLRQVQYPASSNNRGATTSLLWLKREDDVGKALVFGTEGGYLLCWRQDDSGGACAFKEVGCRRLTDPAEISGLAFDATTNRLAVCNRNGVFQIYQTVFPRAVAFGAMHGNERELLAFGLYCGLIYIVHGSVAPAAAKAWDVGTRIGDVALDATKGVLCINDPSTGVNLYRLGDRELVKSFPVPVTKSKRVRQVCLLDGCTAIVSGSDHGMVYVHDRRSGTVIAKLRVHPNEWVQTIATADIAGVPTIFAAKSRDIAGANEILVWGKNTNKRRLAATVIAGLNVFIKVLVLVAALAFAYERVGAASRFATFV